MTFVACIYCGGPADAGWETCSPCDVEEAQRAMEEDAAQAPHCRMCGCWDYQACPGGCSWVPDPEQLGPLCSTCLPGVAAEVA